MKPENFLIGCTTPTKPFVYMIDFGLTDRFTEGGGHKPEIFNGPMGTTPFLSVNAHLGSCQSRRDDLESLAYVAMKLRLGGYPWEDEIRPYYKEKKVDQETHAKLAEIKKRPPEINFKDMPPPFVKYVRKVQAMEYKEEPDYEGL